MALEHGPRFDRIWPLDILTPGQTIIISAPYGLLRTSQERPPTLTQISAP